MNCEVFGRRKQHFYVGFCEVIGLVSWVCSDRVLVIGYNQLREVRDIMVRPSGV